MEIGNWLAARPCPGRIGLVSGPFFVGGTGRCGTSQLMRALDEHPQVHALEWESRFLVDVGGEREPAAAVGVEDRPKTAGEPGPGSGSQPAEPSRAASAAVRP